MFLIIQLHLTCRKDYMQSLTREEMMKLQMYDVVTNVQKENDKEQVTEGSCKYQVCTYRGICGKYFEKAYTLQQNPLINVSFSFLFSVHYHF